VAIRLIELPGEEEKKVKGRINVAAMERNKGVGKPVHLTCSVNLDFKKERGPCLVCLGRSIKPFSVSHLEPAYGVAILTGYQRCDVLTWRQDKGVIIIIIINCQWAWGLCKQTGINGAGIFANFMERCF
jgi:hypothetical protein